MQKDILQDTLYENCQKLMTILKAGKGKDCKLRRKQLDNYGIFNRNFTSQESRKQQSKYWKRKTNSPDWYIQQNYLLDTEKK